METIKKILNLTDKKDLKLFTILIFLSIITILLETLSIGLVVPLVSIIIEPDFLQKYKNLEEFKFIPNLFFEMDKEKLLILILSCFAGIFVIKNIYIIFYQYIIGDFTNKVKAKLTSKLLDKYLCQNYIFHISRKYSNFVANLTTETTFLANGILLPIINLFTEILLLLVIILLIVYLKLVKVIIIFSIFSLIGILILKFTKKYFGSWGKKREEEEKKRIQSLNKLLSGIREIILIGKKKYLLNRFNDSEAIIAKYLRNQYFLLGVPKHIFEIMGIFGLLLSIVYLNKIGTSTFQILTAASFFIAASYRIIPSLNKIVNSYLTLKYNIPIIDILTKELSLKNEIIFNENEIKMSEKVELKNISFKYPNTDVDIFDNVNFSINKGSVIGIVGETGCGKSTLIDIISGLLNPTSGKIYIDKTELNSSELIRNWQNNLSYVSQNTYLMDDTIKNNIAFGIDPKEINMDKLNDAIKNSELKNFVNSLPNKIDTEVGERGVALSGGQIQRIGIARTLYKNSEFIIFDEITSALDKETALKIVKNLFIFNKNKTIIFVTHDNSLLEFCHKVYKIKEKKIYKIN